MYADAEAGYTWDAMTRRARLALAAAVAALALAEACFTTGGGEAEPEGPAACDCPPLQDPGSAGAGEGTPVRGGTLTVAITSEPGTLLSMYSADPIVRQIADRELLEALTALDPASGEPRPELAASWENDPGTGLYTFHLVRDAKWHDGAPFTAADVTFTFEQLLDPAGGAVLRGEFKDVREVVAADAATVTVRLDRDRPELLAALSRVSILPAHVFGKEAVATHPAASAPVGTGPFRFAAWQRGVRIELERNPAYRGAAPHLDRIVYRVAAERRAALDLFRRGVVDVVPRVGGARLGADLLAAGRRVAYPLESFVGVVYNTARPLFADAATRRAIGLLLDRDAIRCSVLRCLAEAVLDPWPRAARVGGDGGAAKAFDPPAARRLLDAAGWRDGDGDGVRERGGERLAFKLLVPDTDRDARRWVTLFEADLEAAGVSAQVAAVGWGVYTDRLRAHRFDAAVVTASNARPFDPGALFRGDVAGSGRNFGAFADDRVDAALDALAGAAQPDERAALRARLTALLAEAQPMTFAFRPGEAMLVRAAVRGVRIRDEWLDERAAWIGEAPGGSP
jgi:peptide/nickel transport system substrate-binding protein